MSGAPYIWTPRFSIPLPVTRIRYYLPMDDYRLHRLCIALDGWRPRLYWRAG